MGLTKQVLFKQYIYCYQKKWDEGCCLKETLGDRETEMGGFNTPYGLYFRNYWNKGSI